MKKIIFFLLLSSVCYGRNSTSPVIVPFQTPHPFAQRVRIVREIGAPSAYFDSIFGWLHDTLTFDVSLNCGDHQVYNQWWSKGDTSQFLFAYIDSARIGKNLNLTEKTIDSVGLIRFRPNSVRLDFNGYGTYAGTTYIGTGSDTSMLFVTPLRSYFAYQFNGCGGIRIDTGGIWFNYSGYHNKNFNLIWCQSPNTPTVGVVLDTTYYDISSGWLVQTGNGIKAKNFYVNSGYIQGDTLTRGYVTFATGITRKAVKITGLTSAYYAVASWGSLDTAVVATVTGGIETQCKADSLILWVLKADTLAARTKGINYHLQK